MKSIPKRLYTNEYQEEAVRLAAEVGPSEAARRLEMPLKTLSNWVRQGHAGKALKRAKPPPVSDLEAENRRLKAEVAALKMEREILKKAAAYFARESL